MSARTRRACLRVTLLEARVNPSTFTWDNGGGDDNWSTGANWVGDVAPTAADANTVVIFNTVDPNSVMDIIGMDVAKIQFDAGSDVSLVLNTDLILDGAGAAVNIQDDFASTNAIVGTGSLVLTNADAVIEHDVFPGFLLISARITGAQGFTKTGVGTLILSTNVGNTYRGTTTVADGALQLMTNTLSLGLSSTIVVGDGVGAAGSAILQLGPSNNFELPNNATLTINGDGRVRVPSGAIDSLTSLNVDGGELTIAGTFQINAGGIVSSNGAAGSAIDGPGGLQALGLLFRFDVADGPGATDLLVSTTLTQVDLPSKFVKTGAGTLEFAMTAANTFTGATFIRDGVLLLNSNTTDAALTGTINIGDNIGAAGSAALRLVNSDEIANTAGIRVNADGLLDVTATANETVAALNLGTAQGGGFAFATGAVFRVQPVGPFDAIDLTGGKLTFNRTGPLVPLGQTVTLIDNLGADPVAGTFAGLPEGGMLTANGQAFTISYVGGTGNDVALTPVAPHPVAPNDALKVSGQSNGGAAVFLPTGGPYATSSAATITPFAGFAGNVRTATADVNGDGTADTILVTGPGGPVRVAVISGVDNTTVLVAPFDPFGDPNFTGGGFVAAGDIDRDGKAEFVVTPDQGGGPRVSIFTRNANATTTRLANFLGIDDSNFRGGARSALGDVNKDGTLDLAVCAGFLGGPRTALFNGTTLLATPTRLIGDFFAFPGADATTLRNGVFVAAGDIDGDGFADLIFGGGPGGAPRVFILSGALVTANNVAGAQAAPVANFFVAGNSTDRGGVRVATKNADGDARADLAAGSGEVSPAKVRIYPGRNFTTTGEPATFQDLTVFGGGALPGGVFVG